MMNSKKNDEAQGEMLLADARDSKIKVSSGL
jgi:hypothetical protein